MNKFTFYILLIFIFLTGCKEEEAIISDSRIAVTVSHDDGDIASNVNIYLYKNPIVILPQTVPGGYIQQGVTDGRGKYTFCELEAGIEYYFYVEDGVQSNVNGQIKLPSPLQAEATTNVELDMGEYIFKKIRILAGNTTGNGIFITNVENEGEIDPNTYQPVTDDENTTYIYETEVGTYKYYAKNEFGCVWQFEVTITNSSDEVIDINLDPCNEQKIVFFSSDYTGGTIEVFLNNETESIGTISSLESCETGLAVYRPDNKDYSYRAEHSNGTCTWIGTTTGCVDLIGCEN